MAPSTEQAQLAALTEQDCLRIVALKGRTTVPAVSEALLADPDGVSTHVDALAAAGLIEPVGQDRLRPTAAGKERVDAAYAAERSACQATIAAVLDRFHEANTAFKEVVTAWQLRTVDGAQVPNDHTDPAHDAAVLRRLGDEVHAAIVPVLDEAEAALCRLGRYKLRLAAALAKVQEGEYQYIAHPLAESYHTVWFELHEELIRLAGRDRSSEAAAGRA